MFIVIIKGTIIIFNSQYFRFYFMSRIFFGMILMLCIGITSCESDSIRENNPYVPNYPFSVTINMELPMYSSLMYPSNAVLVTIGGVGANGIIIFNAGGTYRAYEANCPNQYISNCSRLEIDGIKVVCPCDELEYSLFTGVPSGEGQYTLIPYRVEHHGNTLRVSN